MYMLVNGLDNLQPSNAHSLGGRLYEEYVSRFSKSFNFNFTRCLSRFLALSVLARASGRENRLMLIRRRF
jgi:hypothetical protein